MYTKWNETSLANYDSKVKTLLDELSLHPEVCSVHIGTANSKTHMVNEGTSAGLCGTCDCSCKGDCREGCYAIVHGDGIYPSARKNHAENTICRRTDSIAYYEKFFEYASKHHKSLRVNETGDFESEKDVLSLLTCAIKYPTVRVIGYTKRASLLSVVADLNQLENVTIHFSVACSGNGLDLARKADVPVTRITHEKSECNCPFQLAKMNGGKVEWSCSQCAEKVCGCFSKKDVNFLAH